jgi:aryl-alcohol dehydrogenase-like predicted oxidoreductase
LKANSTLGQSVLRVPPMGIGVMTWGQPHGMARWTPAQLSYGPSHGRGEEEQALEVCLSAGVNLIDTAEMYSQGASERRVGELVNGRDVIIATKFPPGLNANLDDFSKALDASLVRLGRSFIDLFQAHFPARRLPIAQLMQCMADAVAAGKVKAVGVSNYSAVEMRLAHTELAKRGIPLASNQVQYSLLHRKPEVDGVLDACRELGVTLIAYSPLAMGALTGKYSARVHASGLRRFLPVFRGKAIEAVQPTIGLLQEIGERYSKSPSQVALRWLIENEIVLPIPGAKNSQQAAENVGALSFTLSPAEIDMLNQATISWRK